MSILLRWSNVNNRLVRVMDSWANDVGRIFGNSYLGLETNNDTGRQLFKADLVALALQYQAIGAISDFFSSDIEVAQAAESGRNRKLPAEAKRQHEQALYDCRRRVGKGEA